MEKDIKELRNLPLEDLITAPLNAIIKAQANAAMTTAKFIEEIGFLRKDEESFFDTEEDSTANDYDVRIAKLNINTTEIIPATQAVPATGTTSEIPATAASSSTIRTEVELPFISLFNIPSFEINNMEWEFNARLKSMESISTKSRVRTNSTGTLNVLPISLAANMKVETTIKTDFESRFKSGREQEYNLRIKINASTAPLPRGIERLLDIAKSLTEKSNP